MDERVAFAGAEQERRRLLALLLAEEGIEVAVEAGIPRRPSETAAPLSFAQRRLWLIDQLEPQSPLYNIAGALRLAGDLSAQALAATFRDVQQRHEVLRTTFALREGADEAVQEVSPHAEITLPCVDLRRLPDAVTEAQRLVREEVQLPFDLRHGPLFRVKLLRLYDREWWLLLAMHHIVSDGWSIGILTRELGEGYRARLAERPPRLPELPIQYADFALWQRGWLTGARLESELDYWRRQLAGAPTHLDLPTDRPRPALPSSCGGRRARALGRPLSDSLGRLAEQQSATLFMTLFTIWSILLHRYCGADDLTVGAPVANRNRPEIQDLIGFFVNTVVLRTRRTGDPLFSELLAHAREVVLEAFSHQDLPFERLVEELQPIRNLASSPLFQVSFVLHPASEGFTLPGLAVTPLPDGGGTAKFDLALSISEGPQGASAALEYRSDLFDATMIERLLDHFTVLAEGAAAAPDARVSALPLLTAAERRQLSLWNGTEMAYPRERTIHERFQEMVDRDPAARALEFGSEALTYRELEERANRLANRLRRLGVGPETPVGLYLERSAGLIVGMMGILKSGASYVPLDPMYPQERLTLMIEDAGLAAVVTERRFAPRLPAGLVPICLDGESFESESAERPSAGATPANAAYLIYTSGSTGRPKGVVTPHRAVLCLVCDTDYLDFLPTDRVAHVSSISFDAATLEIWSALLNGGCLVGFDKELVLSFRRFASELIARRIDILVIATALFNQVARESPSGFRNLRALFFGGEAADPYAVLQVLSTQPPERLFNCYGPTESTAFATCQRIEALPVEADFIAIGRPIANTTVSVLDGDGIPQPVGVPGELYLGGDGLARGYHKRPELTAERLVPDPFGAAGERLYRTGDLVRWLAGGQLQFLGRIDQQVKIRGLRVEPGEVEVILGSHPDLAAAVVAVREDRPGEKRLVGYGVRRPGSSVTSAELRAYLRERVPDYMVPSALVLVSSLPLAPTGKVDHRALPAPETQATSEGSYRAPEGPLEELLCGLWADLLGLEQVGAEDDFFALGGHSLLATRVMSRLRSLTGLELPLQALFLHPTVAALARAVDEARRSGRRVPRVPLAREPRPDALPLSFAQQRLWLAGQVETGWAWAYNLPLSLRLCGTLHPGVLAQVFGEIVRRHESLRTTFACCGGEPLQVIREPGPLLLPEIDLSVLPEGTRKSEGQRLARAEARQSFDLLCGPLIRFLLLRLAGEEHVLLVTMHHIVGDGRSIEIFIHELGALYRAFAAGEPSPLPELAIQNADFAIWQRRYLQGDALEDLLGSWRHRLAGAPAVLALPFDRPKDATPQAREEAIVLDEELVRSLRALGRLEGATLFMVVLAGFTVALWDWTGQDDMVLGSNIANLSRAETEDLIGFFVNLLPLRIEAAKAVTFRDLLAQIRDVMLDAYSGQEVPFDLLVRELRIERAPATPPLTQVVIDFQDARGAASFDLPGIEVRSFGGGGEIAPKFMLDLVLTNREHGLRCALRYSSSLFYQSTMARLLDGLRLSLTWAAEEHGLLLTAMKERLSEHERQQDSTTRESFKRLRLSRLRKPSFVSDQARRRDGDTA